MSTLEQQLEGLTLGDHICLLYDDAAEALAVAAPFIVIGFSRGERCLYISEQWAAPDLGEPATQIAGALAGRGVDVGAEQERGALLLRPAFEHGFPSGAFDPNELIAYLRGLATDAVAAGFAGLRLVAEMPWTREMASAHDKLTLYEALWNELVATTPIVGLCQYSRHRCAPEILHEVLRTHPLAVAQGHLCQNLYYEPPRLVVDPAAVAQRVDWMIAQLVQACLTNDQLEQRVAERTHELTMLLEVARNVASTLELEPLLALILEQFRGVVDYTAAAIRMVQGNDFVRVEYRGPTLREQAMRQPGLWLTTVGWEVLRRRAPVIVDDMRGDSPLARGVQDAAGALLDTTYSYLRSWLGVPLLLKERVLGVLSLTHHQPGYYTPHHAELVMAIASHIAMAIENAQLYQQVQETAITEERARLAREMHDNLAQLLFYVNTQAEAVRTRLQNGQTSQASEQLEQLAQAARDAYADVREDILALRSAGTTHGLVESLRAYLPLWQEQSGVRADVAVTPPDAALPEVPAGVEIQLVRIVQQALANVRQHAHAHRAQIRIAVEAGQVGVVVEDDGVGFNPTLRGQDAAPHFGLAMMRERAAAVGGQLEIASAPGHGTRVMVRVPVEATPQDALRRD